MYAKRMKNDLFLSYEVTLERIRTVNRCLLILIIHYYETRICRYHNHKLRLLLISISRECYVSYSKA